MTFEDIRIIAGTHIILYWKLIKHKFPTPFVEFLVNFVNFDFIPDVNQNPDSKWDGKKWRGINWSETERLGTQKLAKLSGFCAFILTKNWSWTNRHRWQKERWTAWIHSSNSRNCCLIWQLSFGHFDLDCLTSDGEMIKIARCL